MKTFILLYLLPFITTLHVKIQDDLFMNENLAFIVQQNDTTTNMFGLQQTPNQRLPAFYFAHGSPLLLYPENEKSPFNIPIGARGGPLYKFLEQFGKFLLDYKPEAIVVFSAHWETDEEIEVMSYDKNELYYDFYGFPAEMYEIKFESKGSPKIADRVAELLNKNNIPAKTIKKVRGLDHGVFIPFKVMFPQPLDIPIIEVSMNSKLDPQHHINIGKALAPLRDEKVLILSGGLSIHTFKEFDAWDPSTAEKGFIDFQQNIIDSAEFKDGEERNKQLINTTKHPYFRRTHPREEHYVPIYIGAGAGTEGGAKAISKLHGAITIAFGL